MTIRDLTIPLYQVDAFTRSPFRGNPAAVCLLPGPIDESVMQSIAAEMNLSETAFVSPASGSRSFQDGSEFTLRWFTPTVEVPLCGHATLATSAVLFNEIGNSHGSITYQTLSGPLSARQMDGEITLVFPTEEPEAVEFPFELLDALGTTESRDCLYAPGSRKLLVIMEGEDQIRALEPDFNGMMDARIPFPVRGVIVSSRGEGTYDIISRFFAPWLGIDEDPVTGAAHTVLAPYWARELGSRKLKACQASARGGELDLVLRDDGSVEITGSAVVVMRGEFIIPHA